MLTVILSAGQSRRFREAGWPKSKSLLPMPDGNTLLEYQVEMLKPEALLFLGSQIDRADTLTKLYKIQRRHFAPREMMFKWLSGTKGALDGIWVVRHTLDVEESLLILYADYLFWAYDQMREAADKGSWDAAVVVFPSNNPRFQRTADDRYALGGVFWFRHGKDFVSAMKKIRKRGPDVGVYPAMQKLRNHGYYVAKKGDIQDLGVPRAYKEWMALEGCPVRDW
jgi:molybdopterin-guanine dinucleotide biosynthesis protein A